MATVIHEAIHCALIVPILQTSLAHQQQGIECPPQVLLPVRDGRDDKPLDMGNPLLRSQTFCNGHGNRPKAATSFVLVTKATEDAPICSETKGGFNTCAVPQCKPDHAVGYEGAVQVVHVLSVSKHGAENFHRSNLGPGLHGRKVGEFLVIPPF